MFAFGFFTAVYLFITLIALLMTYDEHLQNREVSALSATFSFLACLFWPITLLLATMAMTTQRSTA
ncbi:hypothetical protein [Sulfitobacter sp.]|jgi:hypothetical protein|uniref:hypothetical protein n=1 Tax=Sulfitobacter sp. TaxID=1903071 RepID=UPI003EF54B6C